MSFKLRNAAALPLLILVAWLARAGSVPSVSIQASPPNPAAGQTVQLRDANADGKDGFFWSFGDGQSGQSSAVAHSWAEPGTYAVHLESQGIGAEIPIVVSPAESLRLNAAHAFEVTVEAEDPSTGARSAGRAYAQSDRYGYFSFPDLTGDPESPEVSVKIVEAGWVGRYWIFYGSMTRLDFTLTIRDVATGQVENYRKEGAAPCGGFDPSSFPILSSAPGGSAHPEQAGSPGGRMPVVTAVAHRETREGSRGATPTPAGPPTLTNTPPPNSTPTFTPSRTKTPKFSPTPTWTPSITPTPTVTPTPTITQTPTITPTPGPAAVRMQVISYQWNFYVDPSGNMANCYPVRLPACAPTSPGNEMTLHVGRTYTLMIVNADSNDEDFPYHTLNGVPPLGLPRVDIYKGQAVGPFTITPTAVIPDDDLTFSCLATACSFGNVPLHEGMVGQFHVVP